MASGLWIGVAAAAGALATAIVGRNPAALGQLFEDDENVDDTGVAAGAPGPAGGGGGSSLGPVAGSPGPSGGGGGGPSLGPVEAQGTPMPASPGGPAGGFPGTFPTMGPASTVFGFGGGRRFRTRFLFGDGFGYYPLGYPYYPPAPNPNYVCQWEETPPKEDTKMICTPQPVGYPVVNAVTFGPPGWGW